MSKRTASGAWKTQPTTKKPRMKRQNAGISIPRAAKEELKNFDFAATGTIVAAQTTALVQQIFTPGQGTSPVQHVGRRATVKSLHYRWEGSFAPTSAGVSPLRLMIVYDKQPNAATPATTQIVQIDSISTPTQLFNSRRFKILVNEQVECVGSSGPGAWFREGIRKFKFPLEVEFNDVNGGTIADIQTGSFIALIWQNGNIITANPTSAIYTRVRFLDA